MEYTNEELIKLVEELKELLCKFGNSGSSGVKELEEKTSMVAALKRQNEDKYFDWVKEEKLMTKEDKEKRNYFIDFLGGKGMGLRDFILEQFKVENEEKEKVNRQLKEKVNKKEEDKGKKGGFWKK